MAKPNEETHPNRDSFPRGVPGPALRALARAGVRKIADLRQWTEAELAELHGMGPKAIATLREALVACGARFRKS